MIRRQILIRFSAESICSKISSHDSLLSPGTSSGIRPLEADFLNLFYVTTNPGPPQPETMRNKRRQWNFSPQRRFLFLLSSCRIFFWVKMIHDVLAKLILVRIELHELFSFDILAINGIDVRHITGRQKICQLL